MNDNKILYIFHTINIYINYNLYNTLIANNINNKY
jgi:hypothetical protein